MPHAEVVAESAGPTRDAFEYADPFSGPLGGNREVYRPRGS